MPRHSSLFFSICAKRNDDLSSSRVRSSPADLEQTIQSESMREPYLNVIYKVNSGRGVDITLEWATIQLICLHQKALMYLSRGDADYKVDCTQPGHECRGTVTAGPLANPPALKLSRRQRTVTSTCILSTGRSCNLILRDGTHLKELLEPCRRRSLFVVQSKASKSR